MLKNMDAPEIVAVIRSRQAGKTTLLKFVIAEYFEVDFVFVELARVFERFLG
ncbi:MAG: hypothetical protein J7K00_03630 [Candidatus Diapherotrites archaeon]|nr:hypothetical protein [Candidatus Diapherotrites archaeon]